MASATTLVLQLICVRAWRSAMRRKFQTLRNTHHGRLKPALGFKPDAGIRMRDVPEDRVWPRLCEEASLRVLRRSVSCTESADFPGTYARLRDCGKLDSPWGVLYLSAR